MTQFAPRSGLPDAALRVPASRATQVRAHVANVTDIVLRVLEGRAARKGGAIDDDDISATEAAATLDGMIAATREGLRRAVREEPPAGDDDDEPFAEDMEITSNSPTGRAVHLTGFTAHRGRNAGAQSRLLHAVGALSDVYGEAGKRAAKEVREGRIPRSALKLRVAELALNPPHWLKSRAIDSKRFQSLDEAPAKLAAWVDAKRAEHRELQPLLPALQSPASLFTHPQSGTPLAPLVKQWSRDIDEGGARGDLAIARTTLASQVMVTLLDYARSGALTGRGPSDAQKRRQLAGAWQPYAVRVGDGFVPMDRFGPLAATLKQAADFAEGLAAMSPKDWERSGEEVYAALTVALAEKVTSRKFLRGVGHLIDALADPARAQDLQHSSPQPGFVDPYTRAAGVKLGAFRARIPGLASKAPVARDALGRELQDLADLGGAYESFPRSAKAAPDPIDAEVARLGGRLDPPDPVMVVAGRQVDLRDWPDVFDDYNTLARNGAKLARIDVGGEPVAIKSKQGATDLLRAIIAGKHALSDEYRALSNGATGGKMGFIQSVLEAGEQAAAAIIAKRDDIFGKPQQLRPGQTGDNWDDPLAELDAGLGTEHATPYALSNGPPGSVDLASLAPTPPANAAPASQPATPSPPASGPPAQIVPQPGAPTQPLPAQTPLAPQPAAPQSQTTITHSQGKHHAKRRRLERPLTQAEIALIKRMFPASDECQSIGRK